MRKIIDEFTNLKVSRQRKWQLRKVNTNRCMICGQPSEFKNLCLKHRVAVREAERVHSGRKRRAKGARSYRLEKENR